MSSSCIICVRFFVNNFSHENIDVLCDWSFSFMSIPNIIDYQVLQLNESQIALLPPEDRRKVIELRNQLRSSVWSWSLVFSFDDDCQRFRPPWSSLKDFVLFGLLLLNASCIWKYHVSDRSFVDCSYLRHLAIDPLWKEVYWVLMPQSCRIYVNWDREIKFVEGYLVAQRTECVSSFVDCISIPMSWWICTDKFFDVYIHWMLDRYSLAFVFYFCRGGLCRPF